jgi:hypothetical protein
VISNPIADVSEAIAPLAHQPEVKVQRNWCYLRYDQARHGPILDSRADALVNTVNRVPKAGKVGGATPPLG